MTTGGGGPSGRLAQAWPRSVGEIGGPSTPWFQPRNGKWMTNHRGPVDPTDGLNHYDPYVNEPSSPRFAFGFGLTFTRFEYADAVATVRSSEVSVAVTLYNRGESDGVEVVQVYVTAPLDNVVRYWKRLLGFRKVLVTAGQKIRVTLPIDTDDLAVYTTATPGSPEAGVRSLLHGVYTVSVGGSSATDVTKTSFSL